MRCNFKMNLSVGMVTVASMLSAAPLFAAQKDDLNLSFSLGTTPSISLSNINGPVTVVGKNQNQVQLNAHKEGGNAQEGFR